MSRPARWLPLLMVTLTGCAGVNALLTPDVLEPGQVAVAGAVVVGRPHEVAGTDDHVPLGQGVVLGGRVGVLPRFDVGGLVFGTAALAVDARVQLLDGPLRVAANAGYGYGEAAFSGFGGSFESLSQTFFAGLVAGRGGFYGGVKVHDYTYRKRGSQDVGGYLGTFEYARLVPVVAAGFTPPDDVPVRPVFDVNVYLLPETVVTIGMGLRIMLRP